MKLAACATFLLAAGSNAFAPGAGNTRSTGCTNRSAGAGYDYIANYSSPQTKNTAIYNFADSGVVSVGVTLP
eukprot:scaffold1539_cov191-Alexandrium_tamarense.AAC.11